jgi:integrase
LMDKEEFMYTIKIDDYEYIFDYDDIQDLKEQMELTKKLHFDIKREEERYIKINEIIDLQKDKPKNENITFAELELKFVAYLKDLDKKVSKSSYKAYSNTFNKLKVYFGDEPIEKITKERFREFRSYLKNTLKLNNKTINLHLIYTTKFLNYGLDDDLITKNEAKKVEKLEKIDKEKDLFTKEDLKNIFEYEYEEYYSNIFKILAYTGMRVGELYNLTMEDIKKDENDIFYFNIVQSKTSNGIRKIPIHSNIIDIVQNTNFPISTKSYHQFQKLVLQELYKVIPKDSTKSTHTFRANFISQCINNYPDKIPLIQEISGHSQGSQTLTIRTYGKGFHLKLKQEIVNSIRY